MDQAAVFVDAGYLFAQGGLAVSGSQKARADLVLIPSVAVDCLREIVAQKAPASRLLRIYWYDGALSGGRPSTIQAQLAHLDNVKLRLGYVNSSGEQKGVDSLIVTDLIELARQKSICDAILVSGDEDLRIGVQIAQNYGVRIHLLGIETQRHSQSPQLMQESDTTSTWDRLVVEKFLSLRVLPGPVLDPEAGDSDATQMSRRHMEPLEQAAFEFVAALAESDIDGLLAYWATARGVPPDLDRRLLPCGRQALGRSLETSEKSTLRKQFQLFVSQRIASRPDMK